MTPFRKKKARERDRGRALKTGAFTIVEVLIVLAILATLGAIALSSYTKFIEKSKIVRAISDIETIASLLDLYNEDNDKYYYISCQY